MQRSMRLLPYHSCTVSLPCQRDIRCAPSAWRLTEASREKYPCSPSIMCCIMRLWRSWSLRHSSVQKYLMRGQVSFAALPGVCCAAREI